MSRVFKCDRCGGTYDRQAQTPRYLLRVGVSADLCPACTQELREWFGNDYDIAPTHCEDCVHMAPEGYCEEFADRGIRPSARDFCSRGVRKEGAPE